MSINLETIRHEALSLPPHERAQLAEQLLSSLDALSDEEIEQLWFQEAAHRAAEMDQGLVQGIPAEEVHRDALALLKWIISSTQRHELNTSNMLLITNLGSRVLVRVTLLLSTPQWSKFARLHNDIRSSFHLIFGAIGFQVSHTTFSTGRRVPTLRSWLLLHTAVGQTTGSTVSNI
jgi:putative addiction module component (TIGR02574 family)